MNNLELFIRIYYPERRDLLSAIREARRLAEAAPSKGKP